MIRMTNFMRKYVSRVNSSLPWHMDRQRDRIRDIIALCQFHDSSEFVFDFVSERTSARFARSGWGVLQPSCKHPARDIVILLPIAKHTCFLFFRFHMTPYVHTHMTTDVKIVMTKACAIV